MITNACTITGAVNLNSQNDSFTLLSTGTVSAAVDGGTGTDTLQVDAGSSANRTVDEGDFINFETVTLNGTSGATGTIRLSAAAAPNITATIDAGGGAGTSLTVARGELNLNASDSSIRANTVTISSGATLSGNGSVFNGTGITGTGTTTVAGSVSPGNSIGLLSITGNYVQTGNYVVEFRAPQDLTNIVSGSLVGRNVLDDGVALNAQDADLIDITGTANLSAGTVVLQPLGTAADFGTAFNAAGNTNREIRYLILRADSGVTSSFAALSPSGAATLESTANDVILVVDEAVITLLVSEPPGALVSSAGLIWEIARQPERVRCDTEAFDQKSSCVFAQGGWHRANLESGTDTRSGGTSDAPQGYLGGGFQIEPGLWIGAAAGYHSSNTDLDVTADSDINRWSGHLWAQWTPGPWDVSGWAHYGRFDVDTVRNVNFLDRATSDFVGHEIGGTVEVRYKHPIADGMTFGPVVGLEGTWFRRGGFTEKEGGVENFTAERATNTSLQGVFGVEAKWATTVSDLPLKLAGQVSFAHEFLDTETDVAGTFEGASDKRFEETRSGQPENSFRLDLGAEVQLSQSSTARVAYGLSENNTARNHAASLRFTKAF